MNNERLADLRLELELANNALVLFAYDGEDKYVAHTYVSLVELKRALENLDD